MNARKRSLFLIRSILPVALVLTSRGASPQAPQVEEIPEDKVWVNPYLPSDECNARFKAIQTPPPKEKRPDGDIEVYELMQETLEQNSGGEIFDPKLWAVLERQHTEWREATYSRQHALVRQIDDLQDQLRDAKNRATSQTLVGDLQARIDAANKEMRELWVSEAEDFKAFFRQDAAKRLVEERRSVALIVLWNDYERISKEAWAAEVAKDKALDGAKADFEAEKTRFIREFQSLKQRIDRSEATVGDATDLKLRSAEVFSKLKERIERFTCWPEVETFERELESVIAKLRRSKTSISFGSDAEVEELPEGDDLEWTTGGDCRMAGVWEHQTDQVGSTVWTIDESGKATESGIGNATGTATLSGHRLTITWTTRDSYAGSYGWDLNESCTSGSGQLVFTAGRPGSFKSTVNRR